MFVVPSFYLSSFTLKEVGVEEASPCPAGNYIKHFSLLRWEFRIAKAANASAPQTSVNMLCVLGIKKKEATKGNETKKKQISHENMEPDNEGEGKTAQDPELWAGCDNALMVAHYRKKPPPPCCHSQRKISSSVVLLITKRKTTFFLYAKTPKADILVVWRSYLFWFGLFYFGAYWTVDMKT